jgi:hypothetical protein
MKKATLTPAAEKAAPTVENENGNQTTTVTAQEAATENGKVAPPAETVETTAQETAKQSVTATQAAPPAETVKPKETIEELQKRLEIELNRLNEKKKLAQHREQFINSMSSLQLYIDELKNDNEFETKSGKLTFTVLETDRYDRANFTNFFSISNTALIRNFCGMLLSEMQQKIATLETQLLTA